MICFLYFDMFFVGDFLRGCFRVCFCFAIFSGCLKFFVISGWYLVMHPKCLQCQPKCPQNPSDFVLTQRGCRGSRATPPAQRLQESKEDHAGLRRDILWPNEENPESKEWMQYFDILTLLGRNPPKHNLSQFKNSLETNRHVPYWWLLPAPIVDELTRSRVRALAGRQRDWWK